MNARVRGSRSATVLFSARLIGRAFTQRCTALAFLVTLTCLAATAPGRPAPPETPPAATMATPAYGICRDRQDHRASQHGRACGEFRPEFQHGCRHGTLPPNQSALIGSQPEPVISPQQETNCS